MAQLFHDWWPFTAKAAHVCLGHFGKAGVVAGPREHMVGEAVELLAPMRVVVGDIARSDDEDVDVARGVAVTARRRPKDRQVDGRDLPRIDLAAEATLELGPDVGEEFDGGRGEMLAVERVQVRVASLLGAYEPFCGQTPKRCIDGGL